MFDRQGPVPIYQQIAQVIHERIKNGDLAAGEAVPSEADLQDEFHIARTTARRVARELRDLGLVHTIQGEGTFVGSPGTPRPRSRIPLYQQIGGEIAQRIRDGELVPDRPIPSEKTLMQQYDIAKATARQVVAWLREHGWVYTVAHRGTYVNTPEKWPADA